MKFFTYTGMPAVLSLALLAIGCGSTDTQDDAAPLDGGSDATLDGPVVDSQSDGADGADDAVDDAVDDAGDDGAGDVNTDVVIEADAYNPNLPLPTPDWTRDIVRMELSVDMSVMTATAKIELSESPCTGCSLRAEGLTIKEVRGAPGALNYSLTEGQLDVGLPAGEQGTRLEVDYAFEQQPLFMGYMENGATLTWPYYCGNLFPCHSEPADGLKFKLDVHGLQPNQVAVYPPSVEFDAPSYQVAWALGEYTRTELGTTGAGTLIQAWTLPGSASDAAVGTAELVDVFSWFEQKLGPYPFGTNAGPVAVNWGLGGGGMEHHPYWHVDIGSMGDRQVHAHEAAHGWFGDGVRLRCYEDLVLSEGTATYLVPRVLGQVVGSGVEQQIWTEYQELLDIAVGGLDNVAWPDTCGEVDVLEGGSFMVVPYMKGAFFYRALAEAIGADVLDEVLGTFFQQNVGTAVGMQDLLDAVQQDTGYDPTGLAEGWLRSLGVPSSSPTAR